VLTDTGPVEISVPQDPDASFEPKIVAKRQQRPSGVEDMAISPSAKSYRSMPHTRPRYSGSSATSFGASSSLPPRADAHKAVTAGGPAG
jgi:hypothetical protein